MHHLPFDIGRSLAVAADCGTRGSQGGKGCEDRQEDGRGAGARSLAALHVPMWCSRRGGGRLRDSTKLDSWLPSRQGDECGAAPLLPAGQQQQAGNSAGGNAATTLYACKVRMLLLASARSSRGVIFCMAMPRGVPAQSSVPSGARPSSLRVARLLTSRGAEKGARRSCRHVMERIDGSTTNQAWRRSACASASAAVAAPARRGGRPPPRASSFHFPSSLATSTLPSTFPPSPAFYAGTPLSPSSFLHNSLHFCVHERLGHVGFTHGHHTHHELTVLQPMPPIQSINAIM